MSPILQHNYGSAVNDSEIPYNSALTQSNVEMTELGPKMYMLRFSQIKF